MRKSVVYRWAITALAAGAMANTAYAATAGTCTIPGGQAIVIGGGDCNDLRAVLGQLQGNLGGACSGNLSDGSWGGGSFGNSLSGNGSGNCFGNLTFGNGGGSCSGIGLPGSCFPGTGNSGGGNSGSGNSGGGNSGNGQNKPSLPDISEPEEPDVPDDGGSQDAYADQVVRLVNEERAKAGLAALKVHTKAESAALLRAKEIERSFSHTRPNGSGFSTVLTSAGISFKSAGENIAYGQKTPAAVMSDWMNSSGHRANILNSGFTSIAVGHYQNSAGVDYWVQLFLQ